MKEVTCVAIEYKEFEEQFLERINLLSLRVGELIVEIAVVPVSADHRGVAVAYFDTRKFGRVNLQIDHNDREAFENKLMAFNGVQLKSIEELGVN